MAKRPKLLLINPNSTQSFTDGMLQSFESLSPLLEITGVTITAAPPAINSVTTSLLSAHAALQQLSLPDLQTFDGIVVACFSDHPLVPLLKERLPPPASPILGIFEAAILTALPLGRRYAIITTDAAWEPLLLDGLRAHHLEGRCVGVIPSGLGVLELEARSVDEVVRILGEKARMAVENRGAEVIVLGCAGMSGLREAVIEAVGPLVPVVDGVLAAVEMVGSLVRQRLYTSGASARAA